MFAIVLRGRLSCSCVSGVVMVVSGLVVVVIATPNVVVFVPCNLTQ